MQNSVAQAHSTYICMSFPVLDCRVSDHTQPNRELSRQLSRLSKSSLRERLFTGHWSLVSTGRLSRTPYGRRTDIVRTPDGCHIDSVIRAGSWPVVLRAPAQQTSSSPAQSSGALLHSYPGPGVVPNGAEDTFYGPRRLNRSQTTQRASLSTFLVL